MAMEFHQSFQLGKALRFASSAVSFSAEFTSVTVCGRSLNGREEQRAEHFMEDVDTADTHRTDGVSVVSVFERDEPGFLRSPHMAPVLKSHLYPDFDCGRAVIRIKNLG